MSFFCIVWLYLIRNRAGDATLTHLLLYILLDMFFVPASGSCVRSVRTEFGLRQAPLNSIPQLLTPPLVFH
ncbi:hypothetical protein J3R30DRAFT_3507694 [Lentinula aciculospora]|uniref:Uncharacterized protein n=1 Tax=Lentinula aciculospora TaxID=153920 RepID=A0A9W9A605_9AGAR|nr:hypothetical protein J3R30DRAFT_3507694 [Lentinula aciculospora]